VLNLELPHSRFLALDLDLFAIPVWVGFPH
jgi:hypothetical protein